MVDSSQDIIGVNVRVSFLPQIVLPGWRELSQVMPKAGEIAPLLCRLRLFRTSGKHLPCKFRRPPSDLVQMAMFSIHPLARLASGVTKCRAFGCEKRLPLRHIVGELSVRVSE